MTDFEKRVTDALVSRIRELVGEDVRSIWLHGSRARGRNFGKEYAPTAESDFDLIVVVSDARPDLVNASLDLASALEDYLPVFVDTCIVTETGSRSHSLAMTAVHGVALPDVPEDARQAYVEFHKGVLLYDRWGSEQLEACR